MKHAIFTTDNAERVEMINGRSVRTYEGSHGNKTLVKKFYLQYELHAQILGSRIGDGHVFHKKFDTIAEVSEARAAIMNNAENAGVQEWIDLGSRTALTHMEEFGFAVSKGCQNEWQVWVTREGGELISEELI